MEKWWDVIDDETLLEKCEAIWTKTKDLKNIELNALGVYDDRYIKVKIRRYSDNVYTNFRGLNISEDDIECGSFRSHIYWFFTCIRKQILPESIFRQLCL